MVLSDLSLSQSATSETVKTALEDKLREVLPAGSFTVILRSYQGDFRARSSGQIAYNAMILLDKEGRKAALTNKSQIESMGFKVSPSGDISAN
jgi:hypothetical protein